MRPVGIGDTLGRYELTKELGEGGMATVYLARDTALKREVAVKVLFAHLAKRRDVTARFQREGRAAAALDHPHILRVFDVGGGETEADDSGADDSEVREVDPPFIVLELVRGPNLDSVVGDPPLGEVVAAIGVAMCEALSVAHQAGIVHRDVKPANVLVAENGRLVLGDFGVARVSEGDSLVTRTGAVLGTPAFMAPEQACGDEADARTDLYSLGVTLYQLGTASLPFKGNVARVMSMIVTGESTPPERRNPALGRDLCRVIEKLMALRPEDRYPDAPAAGAALTAICEVGGFDDPGELLREHFEAEGEGARERHRARALQSTLSAALTAAQAGALPRAMAYADRALALDKDNREALALVRSLGSKRRLRAAWLGGLGLAAVAAAGALAYSLWGGEEGSARQAASAADAAVVADAGAAETAVADDGVFLADAAAARDARGREVAQPASEKPRQRADAAVPVAAAAADAGSSTPGEEPTTTEPAAGWLTVSSDIFCNLKIDGVDRKYRVTAKNRDQKIELASGPHRVQCVRTGRGSWEKPVIVRPGALVHVEGRIAQTVRVRVWLPAGERFEVGNFGPQLPGSSFEITPPPFRFKVTHYRGDRAVSSKPVDFNRSCVLQVDTKSGILCR